MRVLVLSLVGVLTGMAGAQTLDQQSPFQAATFNMDAQSLSWQQEVVVGLAGPLVQVDVYVAQRGSCTFYINDGPPWQSDPPNWTTTFTANTLGWQSIDTSAAGVSFNPGDHFVLGFIGGGTGLWLGGSYSPPLGGYPAGQLWLNNAFYSDGGWDVGFKTYVPEPAALVVTALAALVLRRR